MSIDSDLRSLERAVKARPDDQGLRHELEQTYLRLGLGWHGERLPENDRGCLVAREDKPRIYRWAILAKAERPTNPTALVLDLEWVEGGVVDCKHYTPAGRYESVDSTMTVDYGTRALRFKPELCPACKGTGRHKVEPFYMSKADVSDDQWIQFVNDYPRGSLTALDFCEWAGLRLPTISELDVAGFKGPLPYFRVALDIVR